MVTNPTSRRRLLSLGLLACAGAALSAFAVAPPTDPAWLTLLSKQLNKQSRWLRKGRGTKGEVEFHCGIRDAAVWSASFSKLAAKGTKVLAAGNALTFRRGECAVRVVMHVLTA